MARLLSKPQDLQLELTTLLLLVIPLCMQCFSPLLQDGQLLLSFLLDQQLLHLLVNNSLQHSMTRQVDQAGSDRMIRQDYTG